MATNINEQSEKKSELNVNNDSALAQWSISTNLWLNTVTHNPKPYNIILC